MVAQYVSEKVSDLSAFIFFGYSMDTYPTSISIGYVSRYLIRYGLKYPCFIGYSNLRYSIVSLQIASWIKENRMTNFNSSQSQGQIRKLMWDIS
jgi:hypothetical protein